MALHGRNPGEDHPITVEPTGAPVTVRVGDRVVARTTTALTLREARYRPVQYVPLADVDPVLLRRSSSTTYCPFKGTAAYYDLDLPEGEDLADAVWTYERPYPGVAAIADHVAFYPGRVRIEVEGRPEG
ncbi:DUF427 domain-containing protein [Nocardiopsis sp. MG754419]|uniref:DUF427 domain-containing protein n=1 Tax=Nocardiopsis sp. MG754419 TaxID=2259865 RepID=UPI001BAA70AE|nr:DUF427 domain-containing protein [Nocardiopsis sp. MG754419]MBR8741758.1 hypothetical protein [Nocardiopsis sp. MG754419]